MQVEISSVRPERIMELKDEGNKAFGRADYGGAVAKYRDGLGLAERYGKDTEGSLPYKMEIGKSPDLEDGAMYLQDFSRLKAVLLNNLASCMFYQDMLDQADQFNDMALMEDPDYGKVHYRKCTILEKRGQYSRAMDLAKHSAE